MTLSLPVFLFPRETKSFWMNSSYHKFLLGYKQEAGSSIELTRPPSAVHGLELNNMRNHIYI